MRDRDSEGSKHHSLNEGQWQRGEGISGGTSQSSHLLMLCRPWCCTRASWGWGAWGRARLGMGWRGGWGEGGGGCWGRGERGERGRGLNRGRAFLGLGRDLWRGEWGGPQWPPGPTSSTSCPSASSPWWLMVWGLMNRRADWLFGGVEQSTAGYLFKEISGKTKKVTKKGVFNETWSCLSILGKHVVFS